MANRIRQERAGLKMTQEELAGVLGVSRATITSWEDEKTDIPATKINLICDVVGCSTDWLLGRSDTRRGK